MDWRELQANATGVDLSKIRPHGDFVLAKPFTLDEQLKMEDRLIAPSPIHMTRDGRYREDRPRGNRYARVVATGMGDKAVHLYCESCASVTPVIVKTGEGSHVQSFSRKCQTCGSEMTIFPRFTAPETKAASTEHMPMHVFPGDVVVFPKTPANEFIFDGHEYVFLHEEQHVLAVIEQEAA